MCFAGTKNSAIRGLAVCNMQILELFGSVLAILAILSCLFLKVTMVLVFSQRSLPSSLPWLNAIGDFHDLAKQQFEGCFASILVHLTTGHRRSSLLNVQLVIEVPFVCLFVLMDAQERQI